MLLNWRGFERINVIRKALKSKDVENALEFVKSKGWSVDEVMAEAALYRLKGIEMLAVGFPVRDKAVLVYYEYFNGTKIKSEAKVYVFKDERTARLEFISVNGKEPIRTLEDCGPGLVECPQCVELDGLCASDCCGNCFSVCYSEPDIWCLLCVLTICGVWCINKCCNKWDIYCCPTP